MECYGFDADVRYHMSWRTIEKNLAADRRQARAADAHECCHAREPPPGDRRPASCAPKTAWSSRSDAEMARSLDRLVAQIRACRVCRDTPWAAGSRMSPGRSSGCPTTARIAVCGQAPGIRVHASGVPFTDPSGVRLRRWMGVTEDEFYDARRVAIVPVGFCFPGYDAAGGDLPPRRECAPLWRARRVRRASRSRAGAAGGPSRAALAPRLATRAAQ